MTDYQYRYYDPQTGRWPSRDPIGELSFQRHRMPMLPLELRRSLSAKKTVTKVVRDEESEFSFSRVVYEFPKLGMQTKDYDFVGNQPISSVDLVGLDIYICSTPTMGGTAHHAFMYSSDLDPPNNEWGMHGCSKTALPGDGGGEVKPDLSNCRKVNTGGMSDKETFDKIKNWQGWHKGIWCPWLNDCHGQLQQAVEDAGFEWPGVPGGRLNDQPDDPWYDKECCKKRRRIGPPHR